MKRDSINYAVNIITNTILDELAQDIEALELSPGNRDKVLSTIEMNRIRKRSNSKSRKHPGIKPELRCTRQTKSGQPCGAPRCNTVSCWGHMSDVEKDTHTHTSKLSKNDDGAKVTRSYTAAARAAEDLAAE